MHLEQSVLCEKERDKERNHVYFMPTIARYYLCFLYAWFLIITHNSQDVFISNIRKEKLNMDNWPKNKHLTTDVIRIQIQVFLILKVFFPLY